MPRFEEGSGLQRRERRWAAAEEEEKKKKHVRGRKKKKEKRQRVKGERRGKLRDSVCDEQTEEKK